MKQVNTKDGRLFKNKKIIHMIGIIFILCIISLVILCVYLNNSDAQIAYATSLESDFSSKEYIGVSNTLDITSIIQKNSQTRQTEEITTEETDLEYTTQYQNDDTLPKGTLQVIQDGVVGRQQVIIKKTYEADELIKEEQVGTKVVKAAVNKVVHIGTSNLKSAYKVKEGDILYVTSDLLEIKIEPQIEAQTLITINQGEKVTLAKTGDGWYKVQYQSYLGWAQANMLSHTNINAPAVEEGAEEENTPPNTSGSNLTKAQLLSNLGINMSLNKPSGLSLEQFKKVLSNNTQDKNKILEMHAEYFYYIEKQYNVNGIFVASVGIHESAWGTSSISLRKKNLFGYGAYDSSPGESAYDFASYAEGIDLIARVFVKYYLNPKGTKIYGNEVAAGSHYNGPTLLGVNQKYATDPNWANGVFKWMSYLYNRL